MPVFSLETRLAAPVAECEHAFVSLTPSDGGGTLMTDTVRYRAPYGLLGSVAERLVLTRYLQRHLSRRNAWVKATLEQRAAPSSSSVTRARGWAGTGSAAGSTTETPPVDTVDADESRSRDEVHRGRAPTSHVHRRDAAAGHIDLRLYLTNIRSPTLVLFGTSDRVNRAAARRARAGVAWAFLAANQWS